MRAYRIAPRVREAESAFRAYICSSDPGLKPLGYSLKPLRGKSGAYR